MFLGVRNPNSVCNQNLRSSLNANEVLGGLNVKACTFIALLPKPYNQNKATKT